MNHYNYLFDNFYKFLKSPALVKHLLVFLLVCCFGLGCRENTAISQVAADTKTAVSSPTETVTAPAATAAGPASSGSLYLITSDERATLLVRYELDTDEQTTVFTVPDEGLLTKADLSTAGEQFVLAYAVPPGEQSPVGFTRLFAMPNKPDAEPEILIEPDSAQDIYFHPAWSPDGRFIYYAHTTFSKTTVDNVARYVYATHLEQLEVATGEITTVAENATWPQVSPNGEKLVYVQAEADTQMDTLMLADKNGRNPQSLITPGQFEAIDSPVFSPDGAWIYFSAAEAEQASFSWFGVQTAHAHDIASDWYRLSLTTPQAQPERLTNLGVRNLYGRFSPHDPNLFAFTSDAGLYLMKADGSELQHLFETPLFSSLIWQ